MSAQYKCYILDFKIGYGVRLQNEVLSKVDELKSSQCFHLRRMRAEFSYHQGVQQQLPGNLIL